MRIIGCLDVSWRYAEFYRGFVVITATSDNSPIAAYENTSKKYFGLQFHPEVTHTENGTAIIKNFLIYVVLSRIESDDILQQIDAVVAAEVKNEEVLLALWRC